MAAARPLSKAECLKRYLPAPVEIGSRATLTCYKKLRKVTGAGGKGVRIVDDDVSWADISTKSKKEEKEDEGDLPVVAEFIDERPEEVKQMEAFRTGNTWKLLGEQKSDLSPPRRTRHDSPDSSPPRRTRQDSSDPLQPRRFPFNLPDLVPEVCHSLSGKAPAKSSLGLKKSSTHGDESSQHKNRSPSSPGPGEPLPDSRHSSPRHRKFHWKPSTKKLQRHHVDSSLPGKSNQQASDSDLTPPLNKQKADSNSDLSPPRRRQKNRSGDSDLSPPQRSQPPVAKATQLFSGTKTGLVSYVRRDQHELSKQDQEIKHLEVEFQNTETIFQDKSGLKRAQKLDRLEQCHKEKSEKNEQYAQWGKGLAQSQQQQQNVEDAIREMQKPFSQYINDEDLDQMLREQEREGDPMAKFIKKNKVKRNKDKKERPRYNGPAPPLNRFSIWPGYLWDGVDRSNGFEKKCFIRLANKKAVEELAYKWSTEDM